jgi:hypothetical protein
MRLVPNRGRGEDGTAFAAGLAAGEGGRWGRTGITEPRQIGPECTRPAVRTMPHRRSKPVEGVSRPVGRVLCPRFWRGGGHPSRAAVADSLVRSTRGHRAGRPRTPAQGTVVPLLTLLRVGFTEPPQSPAVLVVSYTTVSPLPRARHGAVCFLWHCPAGHPGSVLPTTLPCGARTFLTGPKPAATARPTHPRQGYCPGGAATCVS